LYGRKLTRFGSLPSPTRNSVQLSWLSPGSRSSSSFFGHLSNGGPPRLMMTVPLIRLPSSSSSETSGTSFTAAEPLFAYRAST
jgi:hypothetical protein